MSSIISPALRHLCEEERKCIKDYNECKYSLGLFLENYDDCEHVITKEDFLQRRTQ